MRSAAEVGNFSGAIDGNLVIGLGELLDEMALHEVAFFFELRQPLVPRQKLPRIRNVLLHKFLHLLFYFFQVLRREWRRTIEIVEKRALVHPTMTQLGLR